VRGLRRPAVVPEPIAPEPVDCSFVEYEPDEPIDHFEAW
jgi:hypothetical protein